MTYLTDPVKIWWLASLDLWAGIIGFIITIIGFGVGIWRILKLEAASAAAAKAVEEFRLRVRHYEAGNDLAEARYALNTALRYLDMFAWRHVVSSVEDARRASKRMQAVVDISHPALAKRLRRQLASAAKLTISIEQENREDGVALEDANARSVIRLFIDIIHELEAALEERVR